MILYNYHQSINYHQLVLTEHLQVNLGNNTFKLSDNRNEEYAHQNEFKTVFNISDNFSCPFHSSFPVLIKFLPHRYNS